MNYEDTLIWRATETGKHRKLDQIIRLVQTAQGARLPIQALVDQVTLRFVPAVLIAAVATMIIWGLVGPEPKLPFMLVVGVSVLIIACPCAMGLATPTSIMIGTGRAAELGVLFRTGNALQHLLSTTLVAFDKTGTLTEGRPTLVDIIPAAGVDKDASLAVIASVEVSSQHPTARAIVDAAEGMIYPEATGATATLGHGVQGDVDGAKVQGGKHDWLTELGVDLTTFDSARDAAQAKGQTVFFAASNGQPLAMLAVSDKIKPSAKGAIKLLTQRGLRVALISGDGSAAVEHLARELGIETTNCGGPASTED